VKKLLAIILVCVLSQATLHKVFAYSKSEYVSDDAHILSQEQKSTISELITKYEKETSNEIAVVTISELKNESIEEMAVRVFEELGVGKQNKDNGILLLIAIQNRELRIEVGYGLEGVLTDVKSSQIIREIITPEFKKGDYFQGVYSGIQSIITVTGGGEITNSSSSKSSFKLTEDVFIFFIIFGYFVFSIMTRTRSWWLGGIVGGILGLVFNGFLGLFIFAVIGLILDLLLSRIGQIPGVVSTIDAIGRMGGGFGGGRSGGGGFGGGRSGGGGSSGKW